MARLLFGGGVEFRDTQREQQQFRVRTGLLAGLVFLMFSVLLARFAWLQIAQHVHYHTLAESKGKQAVVLAWFPKAFTGG